MQRHGRCNHLDPDAVVEPDSGSCGLILDLFGAIFGFAAWAIDQRLVRFLRQFLRLGGARAGRCRNLRRLSLQHTSTDAWRRELDRR